MPTPSLPETEVPPTFSTCPDPDDSSRLPFTNVEMPTYSPHTPVDRPEEDDASPRSDDNSSGPHFDNSDGPVSDADVDAPDSIRSGRAYNDSHKTIDVQIDRTESPCEPSPIESITTPRLRHGVGTSYAGDFNAPPTSRYSQRTGYEMEQEVSLPSMGYGFPSRRVCPLKDPVRTGTPYSCADTRCVGSSEFTIVVSTGGQPFYRNTAIRKTGLRCAGRDQARRLTRVFSMWISAHSRYVARVSRSKSPAPSVES